MLVFILMLNLQARPLFSNNTQASTSKYMVNLKNLIIATQKVRGLTNSYLNGNTAALLLIYSNRDNIKKALGNMESCSVAEDPVINNRATEISSKLVKLNTLALSLKPKNAFSQYTEIIGQMLMLAQSISERTSKSLTSFGRAASTIMMKVMLPMTEYTGRLRGLGAGLAAKGKVTRDGLERIKALSYQLLSLNKDLQSQLNSLYAEYQNKLPAKILKQLSVVNNGIQRYTSYAQIHFATNPKAIDPSIFFNKGTTLISKIISIYDTTNKAILEASKGWF